MRHGPRITAFAALLVVVGTCPAWAYVGPGVGLTLVGSLVGLCLAILAALGAVIMWPLRRLMKSLRARRAASDGGKKEQSADGRK
jgi:hypothetical protein